MNNFIRTALYIVMCFVPLLSGTVASAISQSTLNAINGGDLQAFYQAGDTATCATGTNNVTGAAIVVSGGLSVSQVPEPQRSAFIKAASKYNVSPGALAGLFITEQNGFQLYYNYFDAGKNDAIFTGIKPTDAIWKNDMFTSNKGIWPNQGTFNGPFQFGSHEWGQYGEDGDGDGNKNADDFFDEVYAAAHYFAVLGGTLEKGADGVKIAASSYNGQSSFSIGDGIRNPDPTQFPLVRDLYATQVVLIAQALSGSDVGAGAAATATASSTASGAGSSSCCAVASNTSANANLTGSSNAEKSWNYFKGKGFDDIHVAAIMGSLTQESGFDPQIIQGGGDSTDPNAAGGGGWGIAQWTPGSKIVGIARELNITGTIYELATQLDIVYGEMVNTSPTGKASMITDFNAKTSLADATQDFTKNFEGPSIVGPRLQLAQQALTLFGTDAGAAHGKTSTTAGDISTSSSCTTSASGTTGGGSTTVTQAAIAPFEYILKVPAGGSGHDVYYANQVTDIGAQYSAIDGQAACGLTSLLMIEASLQGTPKPTQDANALYSGLSGLGAYSNSDGISNREAFLNYAKTPLGFNESSIMDVGGGTATGALNSIKTALSKGALVIAHTSSQISGINGGSTSGHYLVIYAVDAAGNFYVANPGARVDSPPEGHAFAPAVISSWLDGFWAISSK